MALLFSILLILETLGWFGWLFYAIKLDQKREEEREFVAAWKRHFEEEVQAQWIFADGVGL